MGTCRPQAVSPRLSAWWRRRLLRCKTYCELKECFLASRQTKSLTNTYCWLVRAFAAESITSSVHKSRLYPRSFVYPEYLISDSITEGVGWSSKAFHLCSWDDLFEYVPGHRLYRLVIFVFPHPFRWNSGVALPIRTWPLVPMSFQIYYLLNVY
jgi:hypothetical protein